MANPFTWRFVAGWSVLFLFVSGYIYECGFGDTMASPRKEHAIFRFSTCIQPQQGHDTTGSGNGDALDASQNLVKFTRGSEAVTIVDDGLFDWELIFAQNNFNSTGVSWYASDFNRLHETFDGAVGGDFEWNSIPFSCNDSRWSFDISNVQRAVLPLTHNSLDPSRKKRIGRGHPHPTIGCAYVYVLSREAWEQVALPGLQGIKRLSDVRCWVRHLYNQRMPLDRSTIAASIQLLAGRFGGYKLGNLPTTMETKRSPFKYILTPWIDGHHPIPPHTSAIEDITATVGESPEPLFTDLVANKMAREDSSLEPEQLKERPLWVPWRYDSLVNVRTTIPWATPIGMECPAEEPMFSAYSGSGYNPEEPSLDFFPQPLETVLEADENTDTQTELLDTMPSGFNDQETLNLPTSPANTTLPEEPAKKPRSHVIHLEIDFRSVWANIWELLVWISVLTVIDGLKQLPDIDHHGLEDWCLGVLTWSLFAEYVYWNAALFRLWWNPEFDIWFLLIFAFLQYKSRPHQAR